jgi:hypothetical protein
MFALLHEALNKFEGFTDQALAEAVARLHGNNKTPYSRDDKGRENASIDLNRYIQDECGVKGPATQATPTNLLTVKFVNHEVRWVAGAGGIARTIDGGKTWQAKQIEAVLLLGWLQMTPGRSGPSAEMERIMSPGIQAELGGQQSKKL